MRHIKGFSEEMPFVIHSEGWHSICLQSQNVSDCSRDENLMLEKDEGFGQRSSFYLAYESPEMELKANALSG